MPKSPYSVALIEKAMSNGLNWKKLGVDPEELHHLKLKMTKLPQSTVIIRFADIYSNLPDSEEWERSKDDYYLATMQF